jgi:hypothetical protein
MHLSIFIKRLYHEDTKARKKEKILMYEKTNNYKYFSSCLCAFAAIFFRDSMRQDNARNGGIQARVIRWEHVA